MLSRALSLAAVMLLIGGFAIPVRAQNLEAGKSPSQIFSGTCAACHKGARGLLKTVAPGSLPGFLRQHYTTSSEMAGVLASYLISNGATDTRYQAGQPKGAREGAKDARQEPSGQPGQLDRSGRPVRRPPSQEASRPDADGRGPARASEGGGQPPAVSAEERGPDGRRLSAKQRLSKRGRANEELLKPDAAKPAAPMSEAAKGDASREENASAPKDEATKPEVQPEEQKSDSAKLDAPKGETPKADVPLRADPVPDVTPAPKSSEGEGKPAESAPGGGSPSPAASSAASNTAVEPQGSTPAAVPPPVAVAPPPPPAPAGPPVPPISQ